VLWPLAVLATAWLIAPFRANAEFPGLPCTAAAASLLERFSYLLFFLPTAVILLVLTVLARRAWRHLPPPQGEGHGGGGSPRRRRMRLWSLVWAMLAVVAAAVYLAFGALSAQPSGEHAVACPPAGTGFTPLHCWKRSSPDVFEMNAFGRRPLDQAGAEALGRALAATKQDVFLNEAFVLDSRDEALAAYSNGRLFVLQRPELSVFGSQCLAERQAQARLIAAHRVAFYRYSAQQSPPVDALFLPDTAANGERQYEVLDFLHNLVLAYVAPATLQASESAYLDRVAAGLKVLNDDLDREQVRGAPPSALQTMRTDFQRIAPGMAANVPAGLVPYRDSRLKRFLENYDLILVAEENGGGQASGQIHSTAYQQHRKYYFQEPQVTRLIGYLYLQEPGQTFTDDQLSSVNWAVF
jgi:hypothetical protein